ncbi:uncharacterized protein MONBRDRAFT_39053 [Monosiga brevicollis MX1]|uniref:deoxyribose-phosphate aldolase n=1 Tax=Monosiga brevicollis TaxID=81824 RepID=A9VBX3_MONBE|nr:uncharacterized protein MONBRDRAFT_39053 [Monosiga brevicollis MX1]EDQ85051.1 predicted protein [Monosiga brevicollis MX1]|eukprot:XP_001750221.1 hypothetical protein [Monosiga brevicollis MX1]
MVHERNPGIPLDAGWVLETQINLAAVKRRAESHMTRRSVKMEWQAGWLLRAVTCIDLTTLSGDDTETNVKRLCFKAKRPIRHDILEKLGCSHLNITTGAICVYPSRVAEAKKHLQGSNIPIASVAAGFPAGQTPMEQRLEEIRYAVAQGATEIDIVITRPLVLAARWEELYDEVKAMRKTSTGKEGVNATFPVAITMLRAIRDYHQRTGYKVGFKPAGGIRAAKDALSWLAIMKEELGDEWTRPDLFRLGASSLLTDIERQLFHCAYKRYAAAHQLAMS